MTTQNLHQKQLNSNLTTCRQFVKSTATLLCWNGRPIKLSRILNPKNDAWFEQAHRIRHSLFHTGCYPLHTTADNPDFDGLEAEARAQLGQLAHPLSRDDVICLYGLARLLAETPMEGSLIDYCPPAAPKVESTPQERLEVFKVMMGVVAQVGREAELTGGE